MDVRDVAPGLRYWTAPHPSWRGATDWPEDVGCVYYQAPDAAVFVDPLVPADEEPEHWATFDSWVERDGLARGRFAHRSLARAQRTGCRGAVGHRRLGARGGPDPALLSLSVRSARGRGRALRPGRDRGRPGAFFLRLHSGLVVAESFMGSGGGLRVCPSPALRDRRPFDDSLRRLLDLPIERVLVSHGECVLRDGRRAIPEALAE